MPPLSEAAHALIIELLPQKSDNEIAIAANCSPRTVARFRKKYGHARRQPVVAWEQFDHLLGTISDTELAVLIQRSTAAVFQRRVLLGIPPFGRSAKKAFDWSSYDHLLGSMADIDLALLIGCAPPTVRRRRIKLGIAVYKPAPQIQRFHWK
jgi:hypothetical protein